MQLPLFVSRRWTSGALLVGLLFPGVARAAPVDEVLRLVPDDVAFCLLVQDLRGHFAAMRESPFAERFNGSKLGQLLRGAPEMQRLAEVRRLFREHLQVDLAELRDDILGDAVALAYRPGPPGQPDQEQNLLVLQARDPALLARLVQRLNQLQKASGELRELEQRTHLGTDYICRVRANEGNEFYFLRGPRLVYTGQEAMLRRVIELDQQAPPVAQTAPPLARQLRQLGADRGLAALWLNPRAFDAELQEKVRAAQGGEAVFLKSFAGCWQALAGAALYLNPGRDVELGLALAGRPQELPPALRRYLNTAAQPSDLWTAFPDDALFAFASRADAVALVDFLGDFLAPQARQEIRDQVDKVASAALGRDVYRDVLPHLGPDWGGCILAPDPADKNWFPHAVLAVRVRNDDRRPALDQSLWTAMNSLAILAVLDHNSKQPHKLAIRSRLQGQVEVKSLVHDKFPPGFEPAFALKEGYLLLASSPEAIQRFHPGRTPSPRVAEGGEVPLARCSLAGLRSYLRDRRHVLLAYQAENKQAEPTQAARQLDNLQAILELFDGMELVQRPQAGQFTLVWRLRPAAALRK
jgi:hypothetical protein